MQSPFPKSSSSAGGGSVVASPLPAGGSSLEVMTFQYPLKLISPAPSSSQKSVLVFLLSYGGGLVGGDTVKLHVTVRANAKLSLVTQGHTKVFKSPSADVVTSQYMNVTVEDGGALCLLPDPVQPFDGSVYSQTQIFKIGAHSSLCVLDWVTQGRTARGENWGFTSWTGRNEVWLQDGGQEQRKERLLVRDTVILDGNGGHSGDGLLKDTMQKMGIFGTLILRGEMMKALGTFFLAEFLVLPRLGSRDFRTVEAQRRDNDTKSEFDQWRSTRIEKETKDGVLWSVAQVRGCVVVKFSAPAVEAGREWIGSMLAKEASIEDQFGNEALMCVK